MTQPHDRRPSTQHTHPCAATVYDSIIRRSFPCGRAGSTEENGAHWCRQHLPSQVEAREAAKRAREDQQHAAYGRLENLLEAQRAVIDAAKSFREAYAGDNQSLVRIDAIALVEAVDRLVQLEQPAAAPAEEPPTT